MFFIFLFWNVQLRYVADDSTMFWAVGSDNGVIAKHAEFCGQETEMVVPFEGVSSGEVYNTISFDLYVLLSKFVAIL